MTYKFTHEEVVSALRAIAAERPDYVYAIPDDPAGDCLYVHGDKPGCLVGTALYRLGVPLETLSAHEGNSAEDVAYEVLDVPIRTAKMLGYVQRDQDQGATWSEAVGTNVED